MAYEDEEDDELPLGQDEEGSLTGMRVAAPAASIAAPATGDASITGMPSAVTPQEKPESITSGPLGGTHPLAARPAAEHLAALESSPSPISQRHGFGGTVKNILDVAGSALFPSISQNIPGSTANRTAQLGQARLAATEEGKNIQEQEAERTAQAVEGLRVAQAKEATQKGNAAEAGMENVVITGPNGVQYSVPRKDAERLLGTITTQQGAGERGAARNQTMENIAGDRQTSAEKIAQERIASQERIAQGRNLTMTEVARIRAASADDPNKLTQTMKTMKQQAAATLPQLDKTLDETEKVAAKLGPVEGRWNDFWQGKVGASDPEFAHYKDQVAMVSSAVTLAHARGRMSNELFEHFQKMFDAGKQSPENMIQALNVAKDWLTDYAHMGEAPAPAGGGGGAAVPAQEPARPSNVPAGYKFNANGPKGPGWYK